MDSSHHHHHHCIMFIYVSCILLLLPHPSLIKAQQPYIRNSITLCEVPDNSTSNLGYIYNGITPTCQAYLTFRPQPPQFNSVSTISDLLSVDPAQLARLNSVPENATFGQNNIVLVPVNCSRSTSGQYYQSSIPYVVQTNDNFFVIANNTLEGLSTCQAIQDQNSVRPNNLSIGMRIEVPLRCACPTQSQSDAGVKYLLSYLVTWGQDVGTISNKFGLAPSTTFEANGLSQQDSTIFPFTTLLIPLQNPPTSSQVIEPETSPLPPPPPPPPPLVTSSSKSSSKTWIYVLAGVLGGLIVLSVIGAIIFCVFFRKSKKQIDPVIVSDSYEARYKSTSKKLDADYSEFFDSVSSIAESLKVYKFEELQSATQNFSPSCWIKGSVYRGTINGDLAAIKRINGDVSKEISILNKINHFNLIRLSGVCFNNGDWYLVYEYAINGPLSEWIHHNNDNQKLLTWTQRIQIALDVATGLNYLHSYAFPPYVHKDIKSDNVLLNGDYRAKIFNFDLARSADGQGGQFVLTRHIVGTKGRMAPEYLENGMISTKLDVYSFGILMLEMLTGKEVAFLYGQKNDLSDVLAPILNEEDGKENLSNFLDISLQNNYPDDLAIFMVRLVDDCLKKEPSARPDMHNIVQILLRILNTSLSWERSNMLIDD